MGQIARSEWTLVFDCHGVVCGRFWELSRADACGGSTFNLGGMEKE